jgi:hypothetical protein
MFYLVMKKVMTKLRRFFSSVWAVPAVLVCWSLGLGLIVGTADYAQAQVRSSATGGERADEERIDQPDMLLRFKAPAGWQKEVISDGKAKSGARSGEVIRKYYSGNDAQSSQEIITYLHSPGSKINPEVFYEALKTRHIRDCTSYTIIKPATTIIYNSPVSFGYLGCGNSAKSEYGEFGGYLTLSAPNGLFTLQRIWRGDKFGADSVPLSAAQKKEWDDFFYSVGFCVKGDSRSCLTIRGEPIVLKPKGSQNTLKGKESN